MIRAILSRLLSPVEPVAPPVEPKPVRPTRAALRRRYADERAARERVNTILSRGPR